MSYNGTSNGTLAYVTGASGFNQALSPASAGYVSFGTPLPIYNPGTANCYECRINFTTTTFKYIMGGGGSQWYLSKSQLSDGRIKLSSGVGNNIYSINALNDGVDHHIAVQIDIYGFFNLYVDGILQWFPVIAANTVSTLSYIGNAGTTTSQGWDGYIDEVIVTAGTKYAHNFTPPSAPGANQVANQIAIYHLDGNLTDSNTAYTGPTTATAYRNTLSTTSIGLTATTVSGGTGPYTYQWQRANDSSGVPGSFSNLSGATTLTYVNTGLTPGTKYWYRLIITDSLSATYTSNDVQGFVMNTTDISIGVAAADSITSTYSVTDPIFFEGQTVMKNMLSNYDNGNRNIIVNNAAVPGSTSANWLPGQPNFIVAMQNCKAFGCKIVTIRLGGNDAKLSVNISASTFKSNISAIANAYVTAGFIVMINYTTYQNDGRTAPEYALQESYHAQLDSLINGSTIVTGDNRTYWITKAAAALYANGGWGSYNISDGDHLNMIGHPLMGCIEGMMLLKYLVVKTGSAGNGALNF